MDLLATHAYQSTIALGFYVLAPKDMTIVHYADDCVLFKYVAIPQKRAPTDGPITL